MFIPAVRPAFFPVAARAAPLPQAAVREMTQLAASLQAYDGLQLQEGDPTTAMEVCYDILGSLSALRDEHHLEFPGLARIRSPLDDVDAADQDSGEVYRRLEAVISDIRLWLEGFGISVPAREERGAVLGGPSPAETLAAVVRPDASAPAVPAAARLLAPPHVEPSASGGLPVRGGLEGIRGEIERVQSFEELFEILATNNQGAADLVRAFLEYRFPEGRLPDDVPYLQIPEEGGLRTTVYRLLIVLDPLVWSDPFSAMFRHKRFGGLLVPNPWVYRRFLELKALYLPAAFRERTAIAVFRGVVDRLQAAGTDGEKVAEVLFDSILIGGVGLSSVTRRLLAEDRRVSLDELPLDFGIRAQVGQILLGPGLGEVQVAGGTLRRGEEVLAAMGLSPWIIFEHPWRRQRVSRRTANELKPFGDIALGDSNLLQVEGLVSRLLPPGWVPYQHLGVAPSLGGVCTTDYCLAGGQLSFRRNPFDAAFFLSLDPERATEVLRYLGHHFFIDAANHGALIQSMLPVHRNSSDRPRSAVIFFRRRREDVVYRHLLRMAAAHPEFFTGEIPHLALPVVDEEGRSLRGISFGELPTGPQPSFSRSRWSALTDGIILARLLAAHAGGRKIPRAEVDRILAWSLARNGVDPDQPAFNAGSVEGGGVPTFCRTDLPTTARRAIAAEGEGPPVPAEIELTDGMVVPLSPLVRSYAIRKGEGGSVWLEESGVSPMSLWMVWLTWGIEQWLVRDETASGGTWVNGESVQGEQLHPLRGREVIKVGDSTTLSFQVDRRTGIASLTYHT